MSKCISIRKKKSFYFGKLKDSLKLKRKFKRGVSKRVSMSHYGTFGTLGIDKKEKSVLRDLLKIKTPDLFVYPQDNVEFSEKNKIFYRIYIARTR